MERLKRFDIVAHRDQLMVVIESDTLPPDPAVAVIPLICDYPAVKQLNTMIVHNGTTYVLATRLISSVCRAALHKSEQRQGTGTQSPAR